MMHAVKRYLTRRQLVQSWLETAQSTKSIVCAMFRTFMQCQCREKSFASHVFWWPVLRWVDWQENYCHHVTSGFEIGPKQQGMKNPEPVNFLISICYAQLGSICTFRLGPKRNGRELHDRGNEFGLATFSFSVGTFLNNNGTEWDICTNLQQIPKDKPAGLRALCFRCIRRSTALFNQ